MKLAIFHCEEVPTLFLLEKAAQKAGFKPYLFHYKDIGLFIDQKGKTDLRVGGIPLRDFSAVFCRGFWSYQNEVSMLVEFCRQNGIRVFDSALYNRQFVSKMHDLYNFASAGFSVPETVFLDGRNQHDAEIICKALKFPVVAKEDRSRKGLDVYLIKNKNALLAFLKKIKASQKTLSAPIYQFQEFIPADFDVRVIVIGDKVIGAIERRSQNPNEFRHNISLGGIAKKIPVTKETGKIALKAAKVLEYEFAGVDLITNKFTGKTYILEVNRSPGFEGFIKATGIDLPFLLMKFFLRFIQKKLK